MSILADILDDNCTSLDGWTPNEEGTITVSDGFKLEAPPEDLTFGTTVAVLTSGRPYLAVGSHPSNVVMEAMDLGHACMSKRGTVQAGDVIVYPAPDGLVAVGPSVREVLTEDIISREDWNNNYNPSSITAFYWEGHYVAFCNVGRRNFGFIFNIKTKELTDLTFYATAGYRDAGTGILFLVK